MRYNPNDCRYRPGVSLGRNSVAGTTLRRASVPEHLLADQHHQPRDGVKNYAAAVGEGCWLGAAPARTAGAGGLAPACAVFKDEAEGVRPGYRPLTVSAGGWAPARRAWLALFPLVALLRCFLRGWLNARSRGKLSAAFAALSERVRAPAAPARPSCAAAPATERAAVTPRRAPPRTPSREAPGPRRGQPPPG